MFRQWVEEELERANTKLRRYCGPNFWFDFNLSERQFELWEKRGPLVQMIFPVTLNNKPIPFLSDMELQTAAKFVRRRRRPETEKDWFANKEYKKWVKNV